MKGSSMRFQVVSFHCVLKNKLGRLISTSFNQDVVTTAGPGQVEELPVFAKALKKLKQGERKKIYLSASEAYGCYDPKLLVESSRAKLKNGKYLKTGDEVKGSVVGEDEIRTFRVTSADSRNVMLDANHPLAGEDLIFDVEITSSEEVDEENPFEVAGEAVFH